jgi:hypothetical protein
MICELLDDEPTLSGVRIREKLEKLCYGGGKTILDDRLRELRPRFLPPPRSFQRTVYRPGELAQSGAPLFRPPGRREELGRLFRMVAKESPLPVSHTPVT